VEKDEMGPETRQEADSPMMGDLPREEFLKHLRDGLNHLHNAGHLRQNPLAALFDVAGRFDTASALRHILTDAIASLKPAAGEPDQSRAWRTYDSLFCCYVQQLGQQAVADQLGVSVRQLRREQRAALEVLADRLWQSLNRQAGPPLDGAEKVAPTTVEVSPTVNEELAWLNGSRPDRPTDVEQELSAVLDLARPLAAQHSVRLQVEPAADLPNLAVHPVALSEMLLNLLSAAIPRSTGSSVTISAAPLNWVVEVKVEGARDMACRQPAPEAGNASLDMAYQLSSLSRCRLVVSEGTAGFSATLTLPALEQLPVLAIDDNVDTLQLLQRYTSGTRYRFVGSQNPEQALSLAEEISPQIVVLDVMMPQVDGWRVLGRLRQNPLTREIPILVCTVVPQEALALSLGANGFIRKPVTRQDFLAALDRQVERLETGSG
jgi:CheY-like chemotaxis protein